MPFPSSLSDRGPYRFLNGIAAMVAITLNGLIGWIVVKHRYDESPAPLPPQVGRMRDESRRAELAMREGRDDDAERHFRNALTARPQSNALTRVLAGFYGARHRDAEAVTLYERAFHLEDLSHPTSWSDRSDLLLYAECLIRLGREQPTQEILLALAKAQTRAAGDHPASQSIAPLYADASLWNNSSTLDIERRHGLFDEALRADPGCWAAYANRVADLWAAGRDQGKREPALRELARFRKALDLVYNEPRGEIVYAYSLFDNGRRRGAVVELLGRLRKAPIASRPDLRRGVADLQILIARETPWGTDQAQRAVSYLESCLQAPNETDSSRLRSEIANIEQEWMASKHLGSRKAGSSHPAGNAELLDDA